MSKGYILSTNDGLISNGITLLSKVENINLENTGQTTLYTVPSGNLIITDVLLVVTAADTVGVAPIIRVGITPNFNEWQPLTTLTGLNAIGELLSLATWTAGLIRKIFTSGDVIKMDVSTGATAISLIVSAFTFGFIYQ